MKLSARLDLDLLNQAAQHVIEKVDEVFAETLGARR